MKEQVSRQLSLPERYPLPERKSRRELISALFSGRKRIQKLTRSVEQGDTMAAIELEQAEQAYGQTICLVLLHQADSNYPGFLTAMALLHAKERLHPYSQPRVKAAFRDVTQQGKGGAVPIEVATRLDYIRFPGVVESSIEAQELIGFHNVKRTDTTTDFLTRTLREIKKIDRDVDKVTSAESRKERDIRETNLGQLKYHLLTTRLLPLRFSGLPKDWKIRAGLAMNEQNPEQDVFEISIIVAGKPQTINLPVPSHPRQIQELTDLVALPQICYFRK